MQRREDREQGVWAAEAARPGDDAATVGHPAEDGTVVNLPPRRHTDSNSLIAALPADTRPLPSVTAYDELLRRRQPDPAPASAEVHHHTPTGTP